MSYSCKRKKGSTDFGRTQRTALYDLYIIDRDKQKQVITTKPQITEQSPTRLEKLQKSKPKILGYIDQDATRQPTWYVLQLQSVIFLI